MTTTEPNILKEKMNKNIIVILLLLLAFVPLMDLILILGENNNSEESITTTESPTFEMLNYSLNSTLAIKGSDGLVVIDSDYYKQVPCPCSKEDGIKYCTAYCYAKI